jgi:hypothetical protein
MNLSSCSTRLLDNVEHTNQCRRGWRIQQKTYLHFVLTFYIDCEGACLWRCEHCGHENDESLVICENCGTPRDDDTGDSGDYRDSEDLFFDDEYL